MAIALPALLQGGSAILGALGGIFGKKEKPQTLDLAKLRADAKANGFNPLTVLRMTGGSGFHTGGQAAGPGALSYLGQALGTIGDVMQVSEDRELATREAEARIQSMTALTAQRNLPRPQRVGQRVAPLSTGNQAEDDKSPWFGVDVKDIPYQQVRAMNGQTFRVRADVLHSIGRKPGDTLVTEDYEALTGEIGGELHGLSSIVDDAVGVGQPWMITSGGRTAAEKAADRANPSHTSTDEGAIIPMKVEIDPPEEENTLFEDDPWLREWQQ